jgi:hypothetical protein
MGELGLGRPKEELDKLRNLKPLINNPRTVNAHKEHARQRREPTQVLLQEDSCEVVHRAVQEPEHKLPALPCM